ncbi:MAG: glycosyltransferase family 1 protein [bacterium]|nr:glycosyltransferase family 1 protein [bacterium]
MTTRPLHIGIDARLTHYRIGGISTYIRELVKALEALDECNRYTIFHSRKVPEPITSRFASASLWTPPHHRLERLALSAELMRFRLDVLHSPDFIPPLRGAKRHVITVHDLTFLHEPTHKDRAAQRYYNGQIRQAVQQGDHILSVSEATKSDLITMLNVPAEKITVQPHGVDPRFRPLNPEERAEAQKRLGLPADYILFIGTMEPRKNIPALLEAYICLKNPPPLVLAGRPGWLFEPTQQRIDQMQRQGMNIIQRQDIEDADLNALYSLASVLVLPAFYEGFGLPALEAMASGTPVIVSKTSSLPEVVGDAGLLTDPHNPAELADALQRVLTDTAQQATMRQRGLERARGFTWERSAQIALSVYTALA